ncbi:MAG TPA: hypothetical protein VEZ42_00500 [Pseudonocardia sp.]|nr:hypothetical protein [Pseudonocardia sp.]
MFDDADELCPDRWPNPQLALAAGPHFCLGASLVLTAGGVLLHRLLGRFPG